jgi:hypothetical protein
VKWFWIILCNTEGNISPHKVPAPFWDSAMTLPHSQTLKPKCQAQQDLGSENLEVFDMKIHTEFESGLVLRVTA